MTKTLKAASACILAAALAATPCAPASPVQAKETVEIANYCQGLGESQAKEILGAIKDDILSTYAGVYAFDNFAVSFSNETDRGNALSVDVEVVTDMTLTRDPKDSPYMQGMRSAIEEIGDPQEKEAAMQAYGRSLQELMPYYLKPIATGFLYQVHLPYAGTYSMDAGKGYELFHLVEAQGGDILSPAADGGHFTEAKDEEEGRQHIREAAREGGSLMAARAVSYNRSDAVKYAKDNATAEPEYSAANGLGSDCANFVSKCINAGGIPEDTAGKWYRAPRAGAYGGENWIRTGYYNNGGVVPYMKGKGYFKPVSSSQATLGSILSWNAKSHVALVTLIDGSTIKYSQHSNVKKASVYYVYSASDNVTFYAPTI